VRVALQPVYNALNSFALLNAAEQPTGLNSWVARTAAAMLPPRRHANRLVFEGLREALAPAPDTPDFPNYLQELAEQDPAATRSRVLERLRARVEQRVSSANARAVPDAARLLSDEATYLACVEYAQADAPFDAALQREIHALLADASALHQLLVAHLSELWETTFACEWRRVQRSLGWQVEMFARNLDEDAAPSDAFQTLTRRVLPAAVAARFAGVTEVVLVPSWHTGRRVTLWEDAQTARLFFSEPPNYDLAVLRSARVGRAELRARLAALADETRLRILELLAQQDELQAQEIIAALELSQSSGSRHLKQLVSLGYLYERRGEGANKSYRLSPFYFAHMAHALEQLTSGEEAPAMPAAEAPKQAQPRELMRFLDRSGRLAMWPPARQRDKLLVLEHLASFFQPGRVYSEKEVNELLNLHSALEDSAALRRALYEYRFINRTRNGARYWLIGTDVPVQDALT
jgi:hypothetical protein